MPASAESPMFPNFPSKYACRSLFTGDDYWAYMKSRGIFPDHPPPRGILLCFHRELMEHVKAAHPTTRVSVIDGELHLLPGTEGRLGILGHFGLGGPASAIVLEELICWGVERFLIIGTAGSLQPHVNIGDLVVCDRAVRDDGTSHHYLPPARYVSASERLTQTASRLMQEAGHPFHLGATWTTDAPYRETLDEIRHYQQEGVLSVEMEAASLFAVAQHRGKELGAIFSISDSLAELLWRPQFHSTETNIGLNKLFEIGKACLTAEEREEAVKSS